MTVTRSNAARATANRQDMNPSRLLCGDGHSICCQRGSVGMSPGNGGVEGWTAPGLYSRSHIRRGSPANGPDCP